MSLDPSYYSYLGQLEKQFGLPDGLLATQMKTESAGDPNAVSPKGAIGLFQFMPETAKQYGIDPADPMQAAQGAAKMNFDLLNKYKGDLPSALAAYNWGQGNLDKNGLDNAPSETKNYISKIMGSIGNALVPSAQAAESDIPEGFVPEDQLSKPSAESDIPPGFVPEEQVPQGFTPQENLHQNMVDTNISEMTGNGLSGIAKQVGAYGLNALQAIPFSDEAVSALGALSKQGRGENFGSRYTDLQQRQQAFREAGKATEPTLETPSYMPDITPSGLGQLAATIAISPLMPGPKVPGKSMLAAIGKGAATGAEYGATYGASNTDSFKSNSDAATERIKNAGSGALTGAAIGAPMGALSYALSPKSVSTTSEDLRNAAQASFKEADDVGAALPPKVSGDFLDKMAGPTPKTPTEIVAARTDPLKQFASEYESIRGQPLTLSDAEILYRKLGDKIDENVLPNGKLTNIGRQFFQAQKSLRDMMTNESDKALGGQPGIEAWKQGNKLWQQSMKVGDIERILQKGQMMDNPATSIRAGAMALYNNPQRLAPYNAEERALIKKMATAGITQEALRTLGSRLVSIATLGFGDFAKAAAAQATGMAARNVSGKVQAAAGQNVIDAITKMTTPPGIAINPGPAVGMYQALKKK